ncbi:uncharacterized protein LOC130441699 [Diorhabda sublineata]|uniref:uncharacterized protein LOC130441699 n=1 Tax=Diorhabda sublineata TaxID=1163346 RepID=UPI0024E10097|nr:uncharacterized protein LOC130441699 [Diorhabda sublineata]
MHSIICMWYLTDYEGNYALKIENVKKYVNDSDEITKWITVRYYTLKQSKFLENITLLKCLPPSLSQDIDYDLNCGLLHRSLLLNNLPEYVLRKISSAMKTIILPAGESVYYQFVVKSCMVCIENGILKVLSNEDEESPIVYFRKGTILGETALFLNIPSKATVTAAENTELRVLEKQDFMNVMSHFPYYLKQLQTIIKLRLFAINQRGKNSKNRISSLKKIKEQLYDYANNENFGCFHELYKLHSPIYRNVISDETVLWLIEKEVKCWLLPNNEILYPYGDPTRTMFIIQEGFCKMYDSNHTLECTVGPGKHLGLLETIYCLPKKHTVIASTDCKLICIEYAILDRILRIFPKELYFLEKTKYDNQIIERVEKLELIEVEPQVIEETEVEEAVLISLQAVVLILVISLPPFAYEINWIEFASQLSLYLDMYLSLHMGYYDGNGMLKVHPAYTACVGISYICQYKLDQNISNTIFVNEDGVPITGIIHCHSGFLKEAWMNDTFPDVNEIYTTGIYFITNLVTSTGIGDIIATTHFMKIGTSFIIIIGFFLFTIITVVICVVVMTEAEETLNFRENVNNLSRFLDKNNIHFALKTQVMNQFDLIWNRSKGFNINAHENVYNEAYFGDVLLMQRNRVLQNSIPIFPNLGENYLKIIFGHFKVIFIQKGAAKEDIDELESDEESSMRRPSSMFLSKYTAFQLLIPTKWMKFTIQTDHKIFKVTDFLTFIASLINIYIIPFIFTTQYNGALGYIYMGLEPIFIFRIFLKLHKAHINYYGNLISTNSKIWQKYLNKPMDMFWDIVPNLPVELIWFTFPIEDRLFYFSCFRLFHLLRFYYITKYLNSHLKKFRRKTCWYLINLLIHYSILVHYLACIWFMLACPFNKCSNNSWLKHFNQENFEQYKLLLSYYYVLNILTTTGIGDVSPVTYWEMVFTLITLLIGKIALALAIDYPLKKTCLYLRNLWSYSEGYIEWKILENLSFPLQQDLTGALYGRQLRETFLFKDVDQSLLLQICTKLKRTIYFKDDYIVKTGEVNSTMYFICKGDVSVISKHGDHLETKHIELHTKDIFGVSQGLNLEEYHNFSYRTLTPVAEVLTLKYDDWSYLLQFFPREKKQIFNRVNKEYKFK